MERISLSPHKSPLNRRAFFVGESEIIAHVTLSPTPLLEIGARRQNTAFASLNQSPPQHFANFVLVLARNQGRNHQNALPILKNALF